MESKKIIEKLNELEAKLNRLKKLRHTEGEEERKDIVQLLDRIIARVYLEKDARDLRNDVHLCMGALGGESESTKQYRYIRQIDPALRVISAIKEEDDIFGLEDFKPLKEGVPSVVNITTNQGITTVATGNSNTMSVNAKLSDLNHQLDLLSGAIRKSGDIRDEEKQGYLSDIATIKEQSAEPEPDKRRIHQAWAHLSSLANVVSIVDFFQKALPFIKGLL